MSKTSKRCGRRKAKQDATTRATAGLERMAEQVFELTKLGWLLRAHRRRREPYDLTETEFLTLDMLVRENSLTVGQMRKRLGVLPAQMSRVLRSLERRGNKPLVKCAINPRDRRKIDVTITDAGRKAHRLFREARVSVAAETLSQLPAQDLRELMRILEKIRTMVAPQVEHGS